ncbi:MAG: glycosyltransferase family 61 protein, partial [Planctomycetota bacterium]
MKRLTEAWKSALPPAWLSALQRRFGHGVPSPSATTTLAGIVASNQRMGSCDVIQLESSPRLPLPGFSVSGDFAAVEAVRGRIGNRLALEQYDRLMAGPVVQPQVDSFVVVLTEARVCQSAGIVVTAENALLADVSDLAFVADDRAGPLRMSHLPRPKHTPLTVAVLTTGPHHNFYHWMIEALPRLDLYERSGVSIDCFYAPTGTRFQRESLDLLGISPDRILPATRQTHLAPARLLASSFTGSPSLAKTDYLSRRLGLHAGLLAGRSRRIFITRAGRRARAVANERELLRSLKPLGFERVWLEAMPLLKQVALFQQAECVVGPHGAGLT